MNACFSCGAELPPSARFCPACGTARGCASESPTRTLTGSAPPEMTAGADERFLPGQILLGRYRILGQLGRGGMGEVYRADDLKLTQPVALKFLGAGLDRDPQRLRRLLGEVRAARQVAHSNVCRVYDIAQADDGSHFISMEYVDGEDLRTLLRRIGRLPPDKALQIARQLTAGLAAVHAAGLLHRDLKPANVMIDGRGNARLTDFGLAASSGRVTGAEIRSGTPGYMAPEQVAGREVSERSDLWALGSVLHELFTGIPLHARRPADDSVDVDPRVLRVLDRMTAEAPDARPASALAVAAALPGGDALAAALAAGETPSPQMVAEAGGTGGVSALAAAACVAVVVLGFVVLVATWRDTWLAGMLRFDKPPEVLAAEIGDLLATLGHTAPVADRDWGFDYDRDQLNYIRDHESGPDRWESIGARRPPPVVFWYRQSPEILAPIRFENPNVIPTDPPPTRSGMAEAWTDPAGRLRALTVVPPEVDASRPTGEPVDWSPLFAAASLDPSTFLEAEPQWSPLVDCDRRAAWTGLVPTTEGPGDDRMTAVRVEAGAWRGRPVYFRTVWPWTRAERMGPEIPLDHSKLSALLLLLLFLIVGAWLARRNLTRGRGDRRGAMRLAIGWFLVNSLLWLFLADHVPTLAQARIFFLGVAWGLLTGGMVWLVYLALEPWVRRLWPDSLIGWSRLLDGRLRDPLIGRDILFGAAAGTLMMVIARVGVLLPRWLGAPAAQPLGAHVGDLEEGVLLVLAGVRSAAGLYTFLPQVAFAGALGSVFIVVLLRFVLRRPAPAYAAACLLFTALWLPQVSQSGWVTVAVALAVAVVTTAVIVRLGLLAGFVMCLFFFADSCLLIPPGWSSWYSGRVLLLAAGLAALLGWGLYTGSSSRPPTSAARGAA